MNRLIHFTGALLLTLVWVSGVQAQSEGRREVLRAPDGYPIHITYYPFRESKENSGTTALTAPVVILLHGSGENRLLWDKNSGPRDQDPFPVLLQKRGYVVVSVDLRKHGDSIASPGGDSAVTPGDYPAMVMGDLVAVKDFLFGENQAQRLNMQKIGIVAIGISAPVAAAFAEFDWTRPPHDDAPVLANKTPRGQDVKTLVLISPEASAGRLRTATSLKTLRRINPAIPFQVVVGGQDNAAKRQAQTIFDAYAPSRGESNPRYEFLTPDTKESGMPLFRQAAVYAFVFKFLDTQLKPMDIPWRDRRSALER